MTKKEKLLKGSLQEQFKKWDKGQHTFSSVENAIRRIPEGKHFGRRTLELLKNCTICPVGNATCMEFFEIILHGICPGKPMKTIKISICPLGCNAETCVLNK